MCGRPNSAYWRVILLDWEKVQQESQELEGTHVVKIECDEFAMVHEVTRFEV